MDWKGTVGQWVAYRQYFGRKTMSRSEPWSAGSDKGNSHQTDISNKKIDGVLCEATPDREGLL